MALSYSNLALVEHTIGNLTEAKELNLKAIAIREKVLGKDHPEFATSFNNLSSVEYDLGNLSEAKELCLKAIVIREKVLKKDHPTLAINYTLLASIEQDLGNLYEAKALNLKAIAILAGVLDKNLPNLAKTFNNLAGIESDLGNLQEAKKLYLKAIAMSKKVFDKGHCSFAIVYFNLGCVEKNIGNLNEAKKLFGKAISIWEKMLEKGQSYLDKGYSKLASVEKAMGNLLNAKKFQLKAVVIREKTVGNDPIGLATSYYDLAQIDCDLGNFKDSELLFRKALAIRVKVLPLGNKFTQDTYRCLANLLEKMGQNNEAKELRLQYLENEPLESTPLDLRNRAFEYFKIGKYYKAEELYNHLLETNFEPAGTLSHLSRLCLVTDRLKECVEHNNQAWSMKETAEQLIVGRILWFKIALGFINDESVEKHIGMLKSVLQKEDAFMEWTMISVLDHLKPKITEHQHNFLEALVAAMSNKVNMEKMNDFEEWREAKPMELD